VFVFFAVAEVKSTSALSTPLVFEIPILLSLYAESAKGVQDLFIAEAVLASLPRLCVTKDEMFSSNFRCQFCASYCRFPLSFHVLLFSVIVLVAASI
jgi:hypothetical protein